MENQIKIKELPFDQYQRYMDIKKIVEFLPGAEGSKLLDIGGYPGLIRHFVVGPQITITDIQDGEGIENYVKASALELPFEDSSFDMVVSLDTLEHIEEGTRTKFLDEAIRINKENFIITAPFYSEAVALSEDIFQEYYVQNFGGEFGTLKEHQVNGLPDLQETIDYVKSQGYNAVSFSSGSLYNWLLMMLLKTSFWTISDSRKLETMFDCLYNTYYYERDHQAPSYRQVIIASKNTSLDLDKIANTFRSMPDGAQGNSEGKDGQAFFLQLLTSVFDLKINNSVNKVREHVDGFSGQLENIHQLIKDKDTHINNLEAIANDKDKRIREMEEWIRKIQESFSFRAYSKLKIFGRDKGAKIDK